MQIPEAAARALTGRSSEVAFTYARTDGERAEAIRSAGVAYTWILSPEELACAPQSAHDARKLKVQKFTVDS